MIRENRVSLWLGFFQSKQEFMSYIEVAYDEDGNFIPSKFQNDYAIDEYDLDAIESDWISEKCSDVKSLLAVLSVRCRVWLRTSINSILSTLWLWTVTLVSRWLFIRIIRLRSDSTDMYMCRSEILQCSYAEWR